MHALKATILAALLAGLPGCGPSSDADLERSSSHRPAASLQARPSVVLTRTLEDVSPGSVTSGGEPDASLAFSADGRLLAVGTFGGYVRVFGQRKGDWSPDSKAPVPLSLLFERRLPGAVVKRVALSPDGARVYAGEMSYDGFVVAFELNSGKELWRFRLADELGTSTPARPDDFFALYSYPQAYCMRAVGDDLIVDGFHSWNDKGTPRHLSRLYRFDGRTGRVVWRFPENAPLPRNISWFDLDGGRSHLVFSAYQWEKPAPGERDPQAAVGLLDLTSGTLLDRHVFEPLTAFFDTVPMWYGLTLDETGHGAAGMMDGRAAIFKLESAGKGGKPALHIIRSLDLATPVEVTGVPIYAGVGWAAGLDNTLFLLTDGRLVVQSAGAQGKTVRADHPNSNTLFAFDGESGRLLWQWKLTTTAQGVAAGKGVVVVSTQQSFASDDPMDYGLTVFDPSVPGTPVEKMLYRYYTAGPIVALAVSPDGTMIAAVEAPVRLADGVTVVGTYRLHVVR